MRKEETVDFNIKAAWHAIYRMYNQQAAKHEITTSIGFVLLNIDSEKGTPATKIAPLMGLEARSLTRILKSMEEKGLIVRKRDPKDGRLVRVFLTPLGKKKKEVSRVTVLTFNEHVRKNIQQDKLAVFYDVIDNISELISDNNIYTS